MNKIIVLVLLSLSVLASACSSEEEDLGVVAKVNGKAIQLTQLEFKHDLLHMEGSGVFVPSVASLRREYGRILGDTIVQELVLQALENKGLGVTAEELEMAEKEVRADYPEGAFEQVLVEEYIDLDSWRTQLKYHQGMKKFYQQVLRPTIKIDYKEAEEYYKTHLSDFYLPERLKLLVVKGPSRELVERALELFAQKQDVKALVRTLKQVATREITIREEQLSASWRNALRGVEVGGAGSIMTERSGFEALVLLEKNPAKVLGPTQAYPLVEDALLEQKLHEAFELWLSKEWGRANIEVSQHLLPQPGDDEELESERQPDVASPFADAPEQEMPPQELDEVPPGDEDIQPEVVDDGSNSTGI